MARRDPLRSAISAAPTRSAPWESACGGKCVVSGAPLAGIARDARRVRDGASRGTVNGGTYYVLQYYDGVERNHTKSRRRARRASSTDGGGGWTRPLGHRSNDRIPPVVSTTENERTPIDANERGTKKILPTHPARPQFFDWHAHESHGHRHRAHPQLLCPQAPQVVAFAHAHPPGAHAQLPAHLSHAMNSFVRSFVRSLASRLARA